MTIRILLADDQELVRTGFRLILDAEPDLQVVGEASNGHQAVARALDLLPDIVLMDIRMPEQDGIEATRRIVARGGPSPRVLILTTFDLDEYVFDALRAREPAGSCSRTRRRPSSRRASAWSWPARRCSRRRSRDG